MNVVMTPAVEIAIRTLGEDDRERVRAWFDHLRNWEDDPFVRDRSKQLPTAGNVRVLKISNNMRIFFKLEQDRIELLDIATKAAILSSGSTAGPDA